MNGITSIFQSIGEEIRLRILGLLLNERELCVCDIMASLEIPQSTASRHLSNLKNNGWITDRKAAVWVHYSMSRELSPLQQSLLPILRHFLHDNPIANADNERLKAIKTQKACCS